MILGVSVVGMALLGLAVAAVTTRPSERDHDRRLLRNPELVSLRDVESLMRAEGVAAEAAGRVLRTAELHRISAPTMWRWADVHGAGRLVAVVDAGLSEDTLLDHLDAGTTPEWKSISIFAELANATLPAGMPLDELVDLDAVPAFEDLTFPGLDDWGTDPDVELAVLDSLPPIADPGFGPFSPYEALREAAYARPLESEVAEEADAAAQAERKSQEEGGDWPAVA